MHPSIPFLFRAFNEPFEGCVPYMYLDVKGLVTVGVGNLIDPVGLATSLPFRFKKGGERATEDQIAAEWHKIKNSAGVAHKGHEACAALTELELNDDAINALIERRLAENETALKRQHAFKEFDSWPADAQLGLLSMAWAIGPGDFAKFPAFSAACRRRDFKSAAAECRIDETGNPGVEARNRANEKLFENAAG